MNQTRPKGQVTEVIGPPFVPTQLAIDQSMVEASASTHRKLRLLNPRFATLISTVVSKGANGRATMILW